MQIAGKIRDGRRWLPPDEPGLTAAMGNVHRTSAFSIDITGDKERIGAFDQGRGGIIETVEMLRWARLRITQWHTLKLAQLNVLRTVAEGLIDAHIETVNA